MKESYRIDELAELWRVSRKTIEREIRRGELSAFRVGTTVRIDKTAVDNYREKKKLDSVGLCRTL